jgi:hypothetical protein
MFKWIGLVVLALALLVGGVAVAGSMLPVQHTAALSASFSQSPQQVWDVIAAPPTWRADVERYEELPSPAGHRMWREYGKAGSKMTYEVLESDPPRKLVTQIADKNLPFGGTWTYEIQPQGSGSILTITENGEVYNPIFRFVSRYVQGHTATIDRYLKQLHSKLV